MARSAVPSVGQLEFGGTQRRSDRAVLGCWAVAISSGALDICHWCLMPQFVSLTVPGRPQAKGRPRFSGTGHAYTPERTRDAEALMQGLMRQACSQPLEGPLSLEVSFRFRRPDSWPKARREAIDQGCYCWYTGRPDAENILKLVMDAGNGILWKDDALVVRVEAAKIYAAEDGTDITVYSEEKT